MVTADLQLCQLAVNLSAAPQQLPPLGEAERIRGSRRTRKQLFEELLELAAYFLPQPDDPRHLLISAERSKLRNNEPHGKDVVEPATDWREGLRAATFALGEVKDRT